MQRGLLVCVVGAALLVGASARVYGQTTVYHLHKELSLINSANKQLKTIGPEPGVPQTAFQTINLKNNSGNVARIIANFETQTGVPGRAGTIAAGSTVSLTLWMKITALPASGSIYPHATIQLNNAASPYLCIAGGPFTPVAALTTTLASYTFSCTTSSAIVMTTSDRFFVTVNAWLQEAPETTISSVNWTSRRTRTPPSRFRTPRHRLPRSIRPVGLSVNR